MRNLNEPPSSEGDTREDLAGNTPVSETVDDAPAASADLGEPVAAQSADPGTTCESPAPSPHPTELGGGAGQGQADAPGSRDEAARPKLMWADPRRTVPIEPADPRRVEELRTELAHDPAQLVDPDEVDALTLAIIDEIEHPDPDQAAPPADPASPGGARTPVSTVVFPGAGTSESSSPSLGAEDTASSAVDASSVSGAPVEVGEGSIVAPVDVPGDGPGAAVQVSRARRRRASRADRSRRTGRATTRPPVSADAVSLRSVSLTYPGAAAPALDEVSLHVATGEFVYLVGASGSGKSSLLRLLYAEEAADTGRVWVAGSNLVRMRARRVPQFRRRLGVVFQDFKLLDGRTVYEQVAFALTVIGKRHEAPQKVSPMLEMVGLNGKEDRYPHELSGGEQQRVAIARALISDPVMLLCDEPTGNLDPATAAAVHATLETVNQAGTTVVMATHDVGLVDATQHRVVVLGGGQIVRDDGLGGYRQGEA